MAADRHVKAVAEFQKILDHRWHRRRRSDWGAAHLQLGRAFALAGEQQKARAAYETFLTLWKNADVEVPILKSAQAEYARLQ